MVVIYLLRVPMLDRNALSMIVTLIVSAICDRDVSRLKTHRLICQSGSRPGSPSSRRRYSYIAFIYVLLPRLLQLFNLKKLHFLFQIILSMVVLALRTLLLRGLKLLGSWVSVIKVGFYGCMINCSTFILDKGTASVR